MLIILCGLCLSASADTVQLEGPSRVVAGSSFQVRWTGTAQDKDYITIVSAGAADGSWTAYAYVNTGNPVTLHAPDSVGAYELRYQSDAREGVFGVAPVD